MHVECAYTMPGIVEPDAFTADRQMAPGSTCPGSIPIKNSGADAPLSTTGLP